MSDSSLLLIGIGIACAVTASILNIVYQIYRMANNDGRALQSDSSIMSERSAHPES